MDNWNGVIGGLEAPSPTQQQQMPTPIPIRVRLANVQTNYPWGAPPNGFLSHDVTPIDSKLETYVPPLSSSASTTTDATIADLTRYIVEDLFIKNKEAHFVDDLVQSTFMKILLGGEEGDLSNMQFNYGCKIKSSKSGESESACDVINFSLLIEQAEGYYVELSPYINAYKILNDFRVSSKKVDLIMKAHVMLCPSQQTATNEISIPKKKREIGDEVEPDDRQETKRHKAGHTGK